MALRLASLLILAVGTMSGLFLDIRSLDGIATLYRCKASSSSFVVLYLQFSKCSRCTA
jgi:hypothetical protein